jgi:long-chain acyl-CoA synthetase
MNIADNLDRAARQFPAKPAIIAGDRQLTYGQLRQAVDRVASGLVARGIGVGDRVALLLPNIPEFGIAYFAAQKVGAIAVAVNVMLTRDELRYIVDDSGARLLFTTADLLPATAGLPGKTLGPEQVIICEGDAPGYEQLDQLGDASSLSFTPVQLDPSTPAAILYTSGTTGRQKGATLSHGNVVANIAQVLCYQRTTPGDRMLLFLPLFHCFGQNFIMNSGLTAGATLILHRRFELNEIVDSIERNRVTMFFAVPAVYITVLNAGIAPDRLASVRYCFSAAASMPLEVAERWKATYGHSVYEGYGLTEAAPHCFYNHVWAHRPGSVGTPLPMVDVQIVNPEAGDEPLPAGSWGEICLRGPNVMLGYWNRPAETAETLRNGWLHTGDIGYLDDDGYLYIVDRTKDMINAAGFKIWPREVEEVLYQHPAVHECAVVGVPDPLKGEAARAYLVLRPGATTNVEAMEAFCREHLAAYKVPHQYEFVTDIPKGPSGKVLKRVLREQAAASSVAPSMTASS